MATIGIGSIAYYRVCIGVSIGELAWEVTRSNGYHAKPV